MSASDTDISNLPASPGAEAAWIGPGLTRQTLALSLALMVTALLWFCVMVVQTRGLVMDDAYIGFQHLRNWMDGAGFTFNRGSAPVEGVTNIAWMAALWPVASLLGIEEAARLLGIGLAAMGLALTIVLSTRVRGREGLIYGAVAGLLLILSFDFTFFTLAGMETGMLAALLLGLALAVVRAPLHWGLVPLGVVAGFTHPEAGLVVPLYLALRMWHAPEDRRRAVGLLAAFGALTGGLIALRYAGFGDLVPNTFHSKPNAIGSVLGQLAGYVTGGAENISPPFGNLALGGVMIIGLVRLHRQAPAFAQLAGIALFTGIAFALYSLPDWTERGRYFAPYLPLAWIVAVYGVGELLVRLVSEARRRAQISAALIAVLVAGLFLDTGLQFGKFNEYPGYVLAGKPLKPAAEWIRDELDPGAVIATRRIGIVGYVTGREVFDYAFGLADREVSGLISARRRAFDDPGDVELGPLWRERQPDYLLEDRSKIDEIIRRAKGRDQAFVLHGLDYCVVKTFPLSEDQQWVLAGRRQGPLPCLP